MRTGEARRREIRHHEVFALAPLQPVRPHHAVVDRRRRDLLREKFADDLRHLLGPLPDDAGLVIDVPRKRPPELVVVVVEVGVQPHDALDRQLARPLDHHRLAGRDQFLERVEDRRRGLLLVGVARREDDVVGRPLARGELAVVEEVGRKPGPQAGDPDAFRRDVEVVRLDRLEVGRLPRVKHRHSGVPAVEAEQEVAIRCRQRRDVAGAVAHVVGRGIGRIAVELEIAEALDALREAEDRLPHRHRRVDAAGEAVDLRPDRDVVPHLEDVGHDRREHGPVPQAAVLVKQGRGHIERGEYIAPIPDVPAGEPHATSAERPRQRVGRDLLHGRVHPPREEIPVAVPVRGPGAEFREILHLPLAGGPAREPVQGLRRVGARQAGVALAIPHLLRLEKSRDDGGRGAVVGRLADLVVEADALERGAERHRGRFQADVAFAGVDDQRIPRERAVVVGEDVLVELQVAADGGVEEAVAAAGLVVALHRPEFRPLPHQLLERLAVPVDAGHVVVHPHECVVAAGDDLGDERVGPFLLRDDAGVGVRRPARPDGVVFAVEQVREMRPRLRLDDVDDEGPRGAGADPRLDAIPARCE